MKVKTRITGNDLTEGICFYGEANYDNETIDRLKQLAAVLEDVAFTLADLNNQVAGRYERSASEIKHQLYTMKRNLLWTIFDEEVAEDMIKLLEEEE